MTSLELPEVVVLRLRQTSGANFNQYVHHRATSIGSIPAGVVYANGVNNIWSPFVKIEIETAKVDSKFAHLRFSHTNKYWALFGGASANLSRWVVADSDQPEEDTSKASCTLFEPVFDNQNLYFRYVRTGGFVVIRSSALYVDPPIPNPHPGVLNAIVCIDYATLVKLPKHVAFKGYNDMYLKSVTFNGTSNLQFSSDDPNEQDSGYEITTLNDGQIRIFSKFFGRFWRRTVNWISVDSTDTEGWNTATWFWPVKIDENTIALRGMNVNGVVSEFCRSHTADGRTDFLHSISSTIANASRLQVEELALDSYVFRVRFHMESAHVYDEQAFLAGSGTAINNTDHENEFTINISYEDSSSFSFSNSLGISTGVTTTFKTGIPRIAEAGIEVSNEVTKAFEWNRETTETKTVEASYKAIVPPLSIIRIDYVGTRGTCNIPFSYSQRVRRSTDGTIETSQHIDGVYTGVNYFDFHFEQPKVFSVADASKIMVGSNASKIITVADASKSKITAAYASKSRIRAQSNASKITAEAESNDPVAADASKIAAEEAESNDPAVADASKTTPEAESNE